MFIGHRAWSNFVHLQSPIFISSNRRLITGDIMGGFWSTEEGKLLGPIREFMRYNAKKNQPILACIKNV
ncbi:hypothetical protein COXBURSA331_0045 (plasmid) [Coxiella burnetii RSA 331]|nr:hypothetical protein COXBURSA331_0045 [Coxiella burnetii RSA 331]ARI66892.1 hypothetical protein B7L74_10870 [Coxiella burnetii]